MTTPLCVGYEYAQSLYPPYRTCREWETLPSSWSARLPGTPLESPRQENSTPCNPTSTEQAMQEPRSIQH